MSGRERNKGELVGANVPFTSLTKLKAIAVNVNYQWVWALTEQPYTSTCDLMQDTRENISDVIGQRESFNPCSHTKRYPMSLGIEFPDYGTEPNRPAQPSDQWTALQYGARNAKVQMHQHSHYLYGSLPVPAFPGIDWEQMVSSVGNQLDGSMQNSTNMLVNIAQIGQTIGMLKNPFGMKNLRRLRRTSVTLSKLLKVGANARLEYRYGWLNLKRDMEALALCYAQAVLHKLRLDDSRTRFTSLGSSQTDRVVEPPWSPSGFGDSYVSIVPHCTEVTRKCSFSLDILRDKYVRDWTTAELVAQRLGFNQVLEALWDLVPFSFVADWFISIDSLLKESPVFWNRYNLRHIGYSIKTTWYANYAWTYQRPCAFGTYPYETGMTTPGKVEENYIRQPGYPPCGMDVGFFGTLNTTQLLDGAALIVQRVL